MHDKHRASKFIKLFKRTRSAMPITPFHFGLGALVHAIAPKHVSFIAFCASNVIIDCESLYNLVYERYPVHAFMHTYIGATLTIFLVALIFLGLRAVAQQFRLPNLFGWRDLNINQVTIGATLGAYSHVVLDSVMHSDIEPLSPFSKSNFLAHTISIDSLHEICIVFGVLGATLLLIRALLKKRGH